MKRECCGNQSASASAVAIQCQQCANRSVSHATTRAVTHAFCVEGSRCNNKLRQHNQRHVVQTKRFPGGNSLLGGVYLPCNKLDQQYQFWRPQSLRQQSPLFTVVTESSSFHTSIYLSVIHYADSAGLGKISVPYKCWYGHASWPDGGVG